MAKYDGAIVIEAAPGCGDLLENARRMADAARSLDRSTRRLGGQLRATTGGYISAVSKSVRAVEALRDEQLTAFGDTADAWERARTRMNGLSYALYDLKRNARDAFVPIATAAAPALTALTNLLSRAVYNVGAFMAALTGQNAFIRAAGAQRKYAGSLKRTTGAVRALERQLASFDELDILRRNRTGSGGSGGVAGAMDALVGDVSLVPIDGGILAFGERLRRLFEAGNYDGVGRAIADGLNGAIEKARAWIRWENVGASVVRVVDSCCEAFNGLVDGVRWSEVGGALGDGIDTVLRTADRLLKQADFARVGQAIGEGLSGAIREIDFDVLGDALSRLLTMKMTVLSNAAATFDWQALGGSLAEGLGSFVRAAGEAMEAVDWAEVSLAMTRGLNRFIAEVDWAELGTFLGGRLSEALGALKAAVTAFDWQGAGTALSKAVNGLVKKTDWTALGQWLNRTIQGMLDFGINFLEGFDADSLAAGIARALDEVDWDAIAQKLWTLLSSAIGKLGGLGGLLNLGGGLDGLNLGGVKRSEAEVGVHLVKRGWSSLTGFVGDRLTASVALAKNGWTSLAGFVGTAVTVGTSLVKQGWTSLAGFVGDRVNVQTSLVRDGWKSIAAFIGDSLSVRTSLVRDGWRSIAEFVGEAVSEQTSLERWGWSSIEEFVGDELSVWTQLVKWGWKTISGFVGDSTTVWVSLRKDGWSSLANFVGTTITTKVQLVVDKVNKVSASIAKALGLAGGGVVTAGGRVLAFAGGGEIMDSGRADWWRVVRKYANGTRRAHGSLFVAGEAGPEVVGHVNGRTEILNKSQIAQAIYGAVVSGMARAVNALGRFVAGHMALCTNALLGGIAAIGMPEAEAALLRRLSAIEGAVNLVPPVAATGAVTPYEVSRQGRGDAELRETMDANNADLIQTIISVIGAQTSAIVQAVNALQGSGRSDGGVSAQRIIEEINRRTQMYSASPLRG